MTQLVLNGDFELNTPPITFVDWNINSNTVVGVGTGIGGSDCAQMNPPFSGAGAGMNQQRGNVYTPDTNYNISCYVNVTGAYPFGSGSYQVQGNFIDPLYNFNYGVGFGLNSVPLGVYVQYTTNFTSPNFPPTMIHTAVFAVNVGVGYGFPNGPNILFDDVTLTGTAICMRGDTIVSAKEIQTSKTVEVPVKDLNPAEHLVFSDTHGEYVKVVEVLTSGPVSRIYEIPALTLSPAQHHSVFMTGGHKVLVDHEEVKARDHPRALRTKCKPPIPVYTVILEHEAYILGNGALIKAFGNKEYVSYRDSLDY